MSGSRAKLDSSNQGKPFWAKALKGEEIRTPSGSNNAMWTKGSRSPCRLGNALVARVHVYACVCVCVHACQARSLVIVILARWPSASSIGRGTDDDVEGFEGRPMHSSGSHDEVAAAPTWCCDVECGDGAPAAVLDVRGPRKRRKVIVGHTCRGPSTFEEHFKWPQEALLSCNDYGAATGSLPTGSSSCLASGRTVSVTTTYSGAFTIEHACKCIEEGLRGEAMKSLGIVAGCSFRFWAATDVDPTCRRLIMSSKYPPEHVFGDVCDRLPASVIQKMLAAHQVLLSRAKERIDASGLKGKDRLDIIDEFGTRCRHKLIHIARKAYKTMGAQCFAHCYIHQRDCPLWPPTEDGVVSPIHFEAGGNICTASSSQNSQPWRWLHSSAVPCIVWLCSVEFKRPAFLLQGAATTSTQRRCCTTSFRMQTVGHRACSACARRMLGVR